ncbi:uncharacterized protein N7515_001356 [Penicillium bovifimosum]|uniref:Isochorismatase-like domain-containing protein n=1 Tax=Penicillium bovifimosum TaxID=126998 RepID=A0A9W9H9I9_9EURO|nr:uncharacterized protein N7515_001356 [Penicillium bovifimosum]KAJ5142569.1 hypothetical protein N7515_001356 [Penicillium bovifimosum]
MKPVLLILDVQNGIIDRLENTEPLLQRLASTIEAARKATVPIIYVVTAFRPGYPEIPEGHPSLSPMAFVTRGGFINNYPSTQVHTTIKPAAHEVIVTKHRSSALNGTDLEMILRALRSNDIVVAGVVTSNAVMSTVNYLVNGDYRVTVLKDCCMDRSEEAHRLFMEMVFPRSSKVVSAEQWVESLSSSQTTDN